MSRISGSRLTDAEVENLRARGIEPKQESFPVVLSADNRDIAKAVDQLISVHPPNNLVDVPYTDAIAAAQLNECGDIQFAVDCICSAVSSINSALTKKYQQKAEEHKQNRKPWMQ